MPLKRVGQSHTERHTDIVTLLPFSDLIICMYVNTRVFVLTLKVCKKQDNVIRLHYIENSKNFKNKVHIFLKKRKNKFNN